MTVLSYFLLIKVTMPQKSAFLFILSLITIIIPYYNILRSILDQIYRIYISIRMKKKRNSPPHRCIIRMEKKRTRSIYLLPPIGGTTRLISSSTYNIPTYLTKRARLAAATRERDKPNKLPRGARAHTSFS